VDFFVEEALPKLENYVRTVDEFLEKITLLS